ncbi:hypothetical protein FB451DRAFT_1258972 [Mycena latifolia]|nr:hypothetical protein FB451DRAFT_1258972 [Mycena latifolia]
MRVSESDSDTSYCSDDGDADVPRVQSEELEAGGITHVETPETDYSLPVVADDDVDREIMFCAAPGMEFPADPEEPTDRAPSPFISGSPISLPTATQSESGQSAQASSSRPQRNKRKLVESDALDCCCCGVIASLEERGDPSSTIQCTRAGCGTWVCRYKYLRDPHRNRKIRRTVTALRVP